MKKLTARVLLFGLPFLYFLSSVTLIFTLTFNLLLPESLPKTVEEKMITAPVYPLFSKAPPILGAFTSSFNKADARPAIIEQFFAKYRSPLAVYGQDFVEMAEKHNLPWELLPAIAMQESNGGKRIPSADCQNPFGWGIHSQGTLCFKNWQEAIEQVAAGLEKNYINQGLKTIQEIMSKYNPISYNRDGSWGNGVAFFVQQIQDFSSNHQN